MSVDLGISSHYDQADRVLTAAARQVGDDPSSKDFAGFRATVVSATAANVGGVAQMFAEWPSSWEADLVKSLVARTAGENLVDLQRLRTEPVVVPLNRAELLEGDDKRPRTLPLCGALDACHLRHVERTIPSNPEAELAAIVDRYEIAFAGYADRFKAMVDEAVPGSAAPGCRSYSGSTPTQGVRGGPPTPSPTHVLGQRPLCRRAPGDRPRRGPATHHQHPHPNNTLTSGPTTSGDPKES